MLENFIQKTPLPFSKWQQMLKLPSQSLSPRWRGRGQSWSLTWTFHSTIPPSTQRQPISWTLPNKEKTAITIRWNLSRLVYRKARRELLKPVARWYGTTSRKKHIYRKILQAACQYNACPVNRWIFKLNRNQYLLLPGRPSYLQKTYRTTNCVKLSRQHVMLSRVVISSRTSLL